MERPPLGLIPRKMHDEDVLYRRILDIIDAMARYADAEKPNPPAWVTELSARTRELHESLIAPPHKED